MIGILIMPMYKLYRYMSVPGRMHQVEKVRFSIISSILVVFLGLLLLVPLPQRLRCSVIVVPANVDTVYVEEDGIVEQCFVKEGQLVEAGQTVATLRNIELEIELNDAISSLQQKRSQQRFMNNGGSGIDGGSYLDSISVITSEIRQLEKRIVWMQARMQRLELKSKIGGTVLAVPYQHPTAEDDELPLLDNDSFISGRHGSVVARRQQRFCEVADMSKWYAVVLLTESQIKFAEPGMKARIKLYARPDYVIETEVDSIGVSDRSFDRRDYNVSADKAMQQTRLPDRVAEMVAAYQQTDIQYYARVPLTLESGDIEAEQLRIGIGGQARLRCKKNRSLGARLLWWLNQNFRA